MSRMLEVWKDIAGYEGLYQVSNLGNVRSIKRLEKVLKPQARKHGYLSVCLYGRGGNHRNFRQFSVHRLVAEAFIPNPRGATEVNHIDENKQNNAVDNLEWVTHQENCSTDSMVRRHKERQNKHPNYHKPVSQYTVSGDFVATYTSAREAQRQTGVGYSNISGSIKEKRTAGGYYWRFAI